MIVNKNEDAVTRLFNNLLRVNGTKEIPLDIDELVKLSKLLPEESVFSKSLNVELSHIGTSRKLFDANNPVNKAIINQYKTGAYKWTDFSEPQQLAILKQSGGVIGDNAASNITTMAQADRLRRTLDDTINAIRKGGSSAEKTQLTEMINIRDNVVDVINKKTGGKYKEASNAYKELLRVGDNINNALGKQGTGFSPTQRGVSFSKRIESIVKADPENADLLGATREFMGKINSQIQLAEDLGLDTVSTELRNGIEQMQKALIQKNDYTKINKIFEDINKKSCWKKINLAVQN